MGRSRTNVLPGFGLTLGVTLAVLGLVVLLPMAALVLKTLELSWAEFWRYASSPRALACYRMTFGGALVAALVNVVFGTVVAWVLVRYRFPGRRLLDALVDVPFALPTAVAGLTLASLFSETGWLGEWLAPLGIHGAYTPLGVVIALIFVGQPFVVRTVQPVLQHLDGELEEAAATLGAGRFRTVCHVIGPTLLPALLTGFSLAFARAIGEYGSVIFISGNVPYWTEIAPVLIVMRLDEYNYGGAATLATVLLAISFSLLIAVNLIERWASRFQS